jgi:L-2-hydroxycarboxylate dehydrogenase (NAD+)
MDGTIYVKPERIRQYVIDLFGYYHVSKADAGMIADNLIDAEIRGVTTHGLTRIPLYTEKLISGLCDARAVPEIVRDYGATALIDAHDGLGQRRRPWSLPLKRRSSSASATSACATAATTALRAITP